jgi:hypothetical protein
MELQAADFMKISAFAVPASNMLLQDKHSCRKIWLSG